MKSVLVAALVSLSQLLPLKDKFQTGVSLDLAMCSKIKHIKYKLKVTFQWSDIG